MKKKVRRNRQQKDASEYAKIEMNSSTGECPFFEERLCAIQGQLNEEWLSNTCFTYPRYTRKVEGYLEQNLTLSCPEAARQALLHADAFDFLPVSIQVRPALVETIAPRKTLTTAQMHEIRIFCLQLLQTPGEKTWRKLAALGVFCEMLQKTLQSGNPERVTALIQAAREQLNPQNIQGVFGDLQPSYEVQALTFMHLLMLKPPRGRSPGDLAVHEAIFKGLRGDASEPDAESEGTVDEAAVIEAYSRGIQQLETALEPVPWLFDHYVLNEMFREYFPFGDSSPYEHYLRLVTRFGLVRFMLATQAASADNSMDPANMARTIQVFCRRYQHDRHYAAQINGVLKRSGWDQLSRVYRFLITD